jgi:hypothetical protein
MGGGFLPFSYFPLLTYMYLKQPFFMIGKMYNKNTYKQVNQAVSGMYLIMVGPSPNF